MLDQISETHPLKDLLASCVCRLQLPETQQSDDLYGASVSSDTRRFRRVRAHGWLTLDYLPTFPALQRGGETHAAFLLSLSRGGLSFLHSEQVYSRENLSLTLPDGVKRTFRALHCRRLGPNCFSVGGEFH